MSDLVFKEETYQIIGAAIEVHRELGSGFLDAVYQEAYQKELTLQKIQFLSQPSLSLYYKGEKLNKVYVPDLICYGKIVIELKALEGITGNEVAQLLNYLKSTRMKLGLLINFGSKQKLEWKRMVL